MPIHPKARLQPPPYVSGGWGSAKSVMKIRLLRT